MQLSRQALAKGNIAARDISLPPDEEFPERIIQFGEGNFLRGFADWMVDRLNSRGFFAGKVLVVQPIESGLVNELNRQDGLYTLILQGLEDGKPVKRRQIIGSVSRGLNPYQDWWGFLKSAENPDMRIMISNTTEAGIAYLAEGMPTKNCPASFPAKAAAWLYHRYRFYNAAPDKGMLILPCELIEHNGGNLFSIIRRLAEEWGLEAEFVSWLTEHNHFCNTLVDRIVTGHPHNAQDICKELGYEDRLLDTGEVFHLWVIEGDKALAADFPAHKAGLNVIWTDNLKPYRDRKVRVLNGAHTMTFAVAHLAGLESVRQAVEHPLVGEYLKRGLFEEILPEVKLPDEEKQSFAKSVLERFGNPYIHHRWLDIALNSTSKFKARCLPTLIDHMERTGRAPSLMSFALAALPVFYRGFRVDDSGLVCSLNGKEYLAMDDRDRLEWFRDRWAECDDKEQASLTSFVRAFLAKEDWWGRDLSALPGLADTVSSRLSEILELGMTGALEGLIARD